MKKNQGIVRSLEFTIARDGDADLLRHELSKRETFLDDLARRPMRSSAPIDRTSYFRNMARRRSEPGLDAHALDPSDGQGKSGRTIRSGASRPPGARQRGRSCTRPGHAPGDLSHGHACRRRRHVWIAGVRAAAPRFVRLMIYLMVRRPNAGRCRWWEPAKWWAACSSARCATRASSSSPTSPRSPSAFISSATRSLPTKSATSDSSRRGSTSTVVR